MVARTTRCRERRCRSYLRRLRRITTWRPAYAPFGARRGADTGREYEPLLFCQAAARTEVVCGVVRAWNTASEIRRLTIRRASIVPSPWLILRW